MYTRRSALFAFGVLTVGLVAGCGSGGGDSSDNESPFIGSYSGTFTTRSGQNGTTNLTVDEDGKITGTIANATIHQNGTVSGNITRSGSITATFAYPALGQSAQLSGPVTLTGAEKTLQGTLSQTVSGTEVDSVNLTVSQILQF